MATALSKSDALGFYRTNPDGLGGLRSAIPFNPLEPVISSPIGPIIVEHVTPNCGEGEAKIRAASTTELQYQAPGDDYGTAVTVAANTSVLLESDTASKAVRVYRDSVYSAAPLGGTMTLDLVAGMNNLIGGTNADENGGDHYAAFALCNHSAADITSITIGPQELGTVATTDSAQLGATGAGTVTTTDSYTDWPATGWALIETNAPATREAVYYSSRTDTALTVPAAGRGLLGTTAAAGASTDTVTPIAPLRIAVETPSAGAVQTIADSTTAPTGVSWGFAATHSTLEPGDWVAVWMHRDVPAGATVTTEQQSGVTVDYTSDTAYSHDLPGYFRIGDGALELYELHVGEDAQPAFTTATQTSATLPITQALSTSTTSYYAVRQRNQFGLESFNTLTEYTTTGAAGEDETPVLTAPTVTEFAAYAGGECDLVLRYQAVDDATPADTWRLYITTDGTTPDPSTDTPTDVQMTISGLALTNLTNRLTLGPYDYGTVVKVVPRVYSSTLDDESGNATVSTVTVDTQAPVSVHHMGLTTGGWKAAKPPALDKTTDYGDVSIRTREGETEVSGSITAFIGRIGEFFTALEFNNTAHSASGTATPIEAIDADTFYVNVNGTRRAKIDLSAGTIEAATFVMEETAIALPVIGPTHATSTETYIQMMDGQTGRWEPLLKVDSSGVMTITQSVRQV